MAKRSKVKQPKVSSLDVKMHREYEGMSPNQITGMLLYYSYNSTKVALEEGVHRQTVWDTINRKRKDPRLRTAITRILQTEEETLHEAYIRIWGGDSVLWFLEHL